MSLIDTSYGVILILRQDEDRFLLVKQIDGHWSFPKGHPEGNEMPKESALRELSEEAGIIDVDFINSPSLIEKYSFTKNNELCEKTVHYFLAFSKTDKVHIQPEEVLEYKWATYEEALETFTFPEPKEVLKQAQEYLNMVK